MSDVSNRVADPAERRVLRQGESDGRRNATTAAGTAVAVAGGTVEVVSSWLDAEPSEARELARCLSDGERLRAGRFAFERDRRRFVVGRARLRYLLASRLGVRPDAVELDYGPRGKPRLSRRFADTGLHFNVSHFDNLAVYAFSTGREIGIDVEAVRDLRDADEIAARFFSCRENRAYLALAPHDRPQGFFNCWTRKEAFIKALGDGLHYPLDRFDVSLAPGEPAKILRIGDAPGDDCGWCLANLSPDAGLVAAIAVQEEPGAGMPAVRLGLAAFRD